MAATCPCCKRPLPATHGLLIEPTGLARLGDRAARLMPRHIAPALLLRDAPAPVTRRLMMAACEIATDAACRVTIFHLRETLGPLGVEILQLRGAGYVMRIKMTPFALDRPEVIFDAVVATLLGTVPTLTRQQLLSDTRENPATAWLRQAGIYLMTERLGINQTTAARMFGRDRTTVQHAALNAANLSAENPRTDAFLDFLEGQVRDALDEAVRLENAGAL